MQSSALQGIASARMSIIGSVCLLTPSLQCFPWAGKDEEACVWRAKKLEYGSKSLSFSYLLFHLRVE